MRSENFQADFLKMASATHATFKNTSHQHFIEQKCDLSIKINEKNLQIWDMQISQIAQFQDKTHFVTYSWKWVDGGGERGGNRG